ncbi:MAG TPA: FecR domain-containing protein [Candidatus Hydrogenedentes bacterium]|nr:FecR domain-containing protein [Candidatus Hydrogenedentota bacterium]
MKHLARIQPAWRWLLVAVAMTASIPSYATDLLHARISHESGGALVRGSQDADWSYATVNTIILPGDTLWIDEQGTLEAELSGGSFFRMADRSKAELQSLSPSATINAWAGSFYVQRVSRSTGDFKIRTPAASILVDRDSQVRVDVVGEGSTTVSVRWGRVTVATDGGAPVEAREGQRVYVDPGLLPSNAVPFDKTVEDAFDAWNRERARILALGDRAMPASVQVEQTPIGYSDLASYGEWVYVDNRQYWRPTVVVDYVPYRDGYWSYGPSYGYSWTGYYPFCYVTSHYGRWNYYPAHGWLWNYDPVWSPAWCATAYYGGNFVWAPLDYYNRPCSYGSTFYVGGVPFSIGFSSYCRPNDLYYGPCSVYPAYNDLFVNVNIGDVYVWNIYGDRYRDRYPHYGSNALVREYNPRRVIRGIESGGAFTVAASVRARSLNESLGRNEFTTRNASTARAIRTSQTTTGRQARVRDTALSADTALDTGSTLRRAQRNLESTRGSDDKNPQAAEARRSRVAAIERSATEAPTRKLPGSTVRASTARSVRNNEEAIETLRGQGARTTERATVKPNDETPANASLRNRETPRTAWEAEARDAERSAVERAKVPSDRTSANADTNVTRGLDRTTRRMERDTDGGNAPDTNARTPQATSRTLNDTRARVNSPEATGQGRTLAPDQPRVREPNLPRVNGGDGRSDRSQSLGTIPQSTPRSRTAINNPVQTYTPEPSTGTPQSRVIPDTSRSRDYTPQVQQRSRDIEAPRIQNTAPRVEAPQQRYEPRMSQPQVQRQQYEAPRIEQRAAPRVEVQQPRYEAPQPRYEAPAPRRIEVQQPRIEAPQSRQVQAPNRSFSAPESRSIGGRGDGGGGGGRGGGEARGRSR